MKRKISVFLTVLLTFMLLFSMGAAAANVSSANAVTAGNVAGDGTLTIGDSFVGSLDSADAVDTFVYSAENEKGYVCFALDAEESAESVKGGWLVEIYSADGELLRSTQAVLGEDGKLPKETKFACADINGEYTVKVSAANVGNAPVDTEYTVEVQQVYKFKGLFDKFLAFDLSVFEWVQGIQGKFLSTVMVVITTLGDEGIIFIAMAFVFLFTKKYRKIGFAMLVALGVMVICNNVILKDLLARPRPFNLYNIDPDTYYRWGGDTAKYFFPYLVKQPSSFSFPSGHTSSAFVAAFAILFYNKKIGIPMTVFAAIMGFSRIYVEVHYCTDVLAGAIVGLLYAVIAVVIINLVYPYFEKIVDGLTKKIKGKKA